jgi:pimeloyl-ACP methyl ester carboxylesterase
MRQKVEKNLRFIDVNGHRFAYIDEGQGPLAVLAHCSSASHTEWTQLIAALKPRFRVIAPDLAGYGRSGRWREGQPFDPMLDVDMLITMCGLQSGSAHLVGHSYGGAIALEAARLMMSRVRSLTLIEPPSFHLLREGGFPKEDKTIADLVGRVRRAMAKGDRRAAASAYMGFWIGRVRWWLAPAKLKAAVLDTMGKTAQEFEMIDGLALRLEDYRLVTAPTRLICGSRTTAPAKAVTRLLASAIPNAQVCEIKRAGHMSPYSHTDVVNARILEHIDAHS